MTTINQLSAVDSVASSDQVPIYSSTNGDARKASINVLKQFILADATFNDDKISQYAAPTANGFTVYINNASDSVWLILTPFDVYEYGSLVMPAVANCVDRQEVLVNSTKELTSINISGNGATILGAPTTLAENDFFRLRFDSVMKTWYRVG
jgi:hypothetical protein